MTNLFSLLPEDVHQEILLHLDGYDMERAENTELYPGICSKPTFWIDKLIANNYGEDLNGRTLYQLIKIYYRSTCWDRARMLTIDEKVGRDTYKMRFFYGEASDKPINQINKCQNRLMLITGDGELYTFGHCFKAILGLGSQTSCKYPHRISDGVISVEVQEGYSLFITDYGNLYLIGPNYTQPQLICDDNIIQIAAGKSFAAAVNYLGQVYIFGANPFFENHNISSPTIVPGLTNIKQVSCGSNHINWLTNDGDLWHRETGTPAAKLLGQEIKSVVSGTYITAFINNNGTAFILGQIPSCYRYGKIYQRITISHPLPIPTSHNVAEIMCREENIIYRTVYNDIYHVVYDGGLKSYKVTTEKINSLKLLTVN